MKMKIKPVKEICQKCRRCIPNGKQGWIEEDERLWNKGFVYCGFFNYYHRDFTSSHEKFPYPWCNYLLEHVICQAQ